GDQIGKQVIQFEKGPSNKVYLKTISFQEIASDTTADGMYRSLMNSNLQPLEASFDVKAFSPEGNGVVIDVTDYINGDNDILFFDSRIKKALNLTALLPDRSYIVGIKAFPLNVEIKTMKTYMKSAPAAPGSPMPGSSSPATYELNSSMVLLPKVPMQPRFFDPRVGYFATSSIDFDANPQGVKRVAFVTRWKLEPKPEDVEKYKKGILVEPIKPIVYYIDPATPKKWIPYLIQGVNDWQVAFEQAGFKNAIIAKEAPVNDSTWSLDDARNSAIVYKPSSIANASGPNVNDPRSGEIIETHINWYHNVMELVHDWYFVQAAAVDPRARKMEFDEDLMGQLIRFVSSHEVGHTLGLRHNFGSSASVPVENLRNKKWLDEHGHTPSIMDYARFNYVAQPEDKIGDAGMYPHIGEYDKWAIEWGYKWLPQFQSAKAEEGYLNKLVIDRLSKNPRLIFGTESDPDDPRNQSEDLGDNSMKASAYGIKNLKRILPNLMEWTKEPNEGYENANKMYGQLVGQFSRYMGHVTKNIGGIETTPSFTEQSKIVYEFVSKKTQKEALDFLNDQLFTTPKWLINKDLFSYSGVDAMQNISAIQKRALGSLMSANTLNKMLRSEAFDASAAYTATQFLNDLKNDIWSELKSKTPIDMYRRNLQKMYVQQVIDFLTPDTKAPAALAFGRGASGPSDSQTNDGLSIMKGQARNLVSEIKLVIPQMTDSASKLHLQDVMERLKIALDPKN
ncbi:MAG: zinc-dependent metalloprotease, partial [Ginsengibacter sp.]